MGIETGTAMLIGGALAGAGAIASAASAPDAPSIPPPPPPASYEQYDENGNLLTQQIWDKEKNTYVTKFDPEPEKYKGGTMPPPDPGFIYNYAGTRPERRVPIQQQANTEWTNSSDYAPSHINLPQQQDSQGWVSQQPETDEEYQQRLNQWQSKRDQATAMWNEQYPATPTEEWTAWNKRKTERDTKQAKQAEEDRIRMEIRGKTLNEINQTPEDRIKAYEDYAANFSNQMHRDVDKRYADYQAEQKRTMDLNRTAADEEANARGMFGSRAWVDRQNKLDTDYGVEMRRAETDKQNIDTDIAQKAALAKEALAQQDRAYNLQVLDATQAKLSPEQIYALQQSQNAAQIASQGTSGAMARYFADTNNTMQKWQTELGRNTALTNATAGVAGSLGAAYLYGGVRGGTGDIPKVTDVSGPFNNYSASAATKYGGLTIPNYYKLPNYGYLGGN